MESNRKAVSIIAGSIFLLSGHSVEAASPAERTLTITGITVVDVKNGNLSPDMTLLIEEGKIVKIVPSSSADTGTGAQTVDAQGKFIIPGYLDMHAHPLNLVLLDANPVVDVANMHKIAGVVRDGIYYFKSALDQLRENALPQDAP